MSQPASSGAAPALGEGVAWGFCALGGAMVVALVALRAGDLAYLHVHPMDDPAGVSGPEVAFMAEAPSPGRYLLYLDFQVDGRVHTATFTTTAH